MKSLQIAGRQFALMSRLSVLILAFMLKIFAARAQAAPIAGKVGVGTFNTQAEFADVKVVQGATTLYQSNFANGASEWTTIGGDWSTQNGAYRQTGGGAPSLAFARVSFCRRCELD